MSEVCIKAGSYCPVCRGVCGVDCHHPARLFHSGSIYLDRALELKKALTTAINVADEARREWDAAPEGMKAGKLLIALSGHLPGYRADIDALHAALAKAQS